MEGASKVLALFDDKPLVRRQAKRLLDSLCMEVRVVIGHDQARVTEALRDLPVQIIHNPKHADGMGTSIACAASRVSKQGLLLAFADMPDLDTPHFDAIIARWQKLGAQQIVRGANRDAPGHPILFPSKHVPMLRNLSGDQGAKALVEGAELVDIGNAATLDVDTRAEVRKAGGQPG